MQEFVKFLGLHTQQSCLFVDFAGTQQVHGYLDHGCACTFAVAGLEHPKFAVLDGEFHVLHIFVVFFEAVGNGDELGGALGHRFLERGILGGANVFVDALEGCPATAAFDGDLLRRADAGNYVFALSVDQVFAVEDVLAGGGIAAEGHAGGAIVAHIAVYHSLYVDGRTPFFGDLVHAAIYDGAFVHP